MLLFQPEQIFPTQGCFGSESGSTGHHEITLMPVSSDRPAWNLVWRGQCNMSPAFRNVWFLTNVPLDMWACRIHQHAIQPGPAHMFLSHVQQFLWWCLQVWIRLWPLVCAGCLASPARTSTWSWWPRSRPGNSRRAASLQGTSAHMRSETPRFTWGILALPAYSHIKYFRHKVLFIYWKVQHL